MAPKFIKIESGLFLNADSEIYFVRKTFRKLRIPDLNASTGESSIGRARSKASVMTTDHLNRYLGGADVGIAGGRRGKTFKQVVDEVLSFELPKKRRTTQAQYKRFLDELVTEWGTWELSRINRSAFNHWLLEFRGRKPNRKTFMDYAKYMNKVMRFAYQHEHITHLVTFSNPDTTQSQWRVYTHAEIESLWSVMNEETKDQFVLCFECMMRLREALYLSWDRVDLKAGTVLLRAEDVKTGSKTKRGRTFKLSPNALGRLKARFKATGTSKWVFPSPVDQAQPIEQNKTAWKEAKRKAGIKGSARWHDLRHTAISRALLDQKVEPILVSEYAGVSLSTIQRVYLHSTADKTAGVSTAVSVAK